MSEAEFGTIIGPGIRESASGSGLRKMAAPIGGSGQGRRVTGNELKALVSRVRLPGVSTATLSTKGQLVIPNRFRKALHLQPGDKVSFALEGEKLVMQRDAPRRARLVRGKFGRPVLVAPPGAPPMTPERVQAILEEFP